jgi:hypothetical protein
MDRIISDEWSDDEYNVELEHDEYRVWDLIVKNTSRIGMAKVPKSLMCWRAKRLDQSRYDEIIQKLINDAKLIVDSGYYIIVNHYKYWNYSKPTGAKGALHDLLSVLNEINHTSPIISVVQNICKRIEQQSANNKNVEEITTLIEQVLNTCITGVEQHERERERERERENKEKEKTNNIPPISPQPEKSTFTKAEEAEEALMEMKGYGNIADIVGVKDKMYVRIHWIEDIRRRFPKTYKDAVIKALRKQAEAGRQMANPEGYIEAILVNKNGGKYNGKKK